MPLDSFIERIKAHPDASKIGMILSHTGIVRGTSRNGRPVSGFDLSVDRLALDSILTRQKKKPGIVEILVEIREGFLAVGDVVMYLVVAGDIRDNVIRVLEETLNAIKKEVTKKTEHFV